jgi:nitrite reductase/ring-hydroxylating ferredoxin subunit
LNQHPEALDWSKMVAELATTQRTLWPAPYSFFRLDRDGLETVRLNDWPALWQKSPPPKGRSGLFWGQARDRGAIEASAAAFVARLGSLLDRAGARVGMPLYLSTVDSLDVLETGERRLMLRVELDRERRGAVVITVGELKSPYLHIVSTSAIVDGFLRGEVTLDDLLLSARARFARDPDSFNVTLHNLLRFGHDLDAAEVLVSEMQARKRSSALITVQTEGRTFTIPKLCPHEGESLELAKVCGLRITCPRHRWTFDLESGKCVEGGDESVNLYRQSGSG